MNQEPVSGSGYLSFDRDIEQGGAYRYTGPARTSARMANDRYTKMILSSVDFEGKSVVDVGSGDGTYTAQLARQSGAGSVLGVEPSPRAVERAVDQYGGIPNLEFKCATSEDLLDASQHFDIAVYRGVIHHVPHGRKEIGRAVGLAKTLVVLEPNGSNPFMKLIEKASRYHREHEEQSFTMATMKTWISDAGGAVTGGTYFGLVPYFCPTWIARLGRFFEGPVERFPGLRAVCCGQYLAVAEGVSP